MRADGKVELYVISSDYSNDHWIDNAFKIDLPPIAEDIMAYDSEAYKKSNLSILSKNPWHQIALCHLWNSIRDKVFHEQRLLLEKTDNVDERYIIWRNMLFLREEKKHYSMGIKMYLKDAGY